MTKKQWIIISVLGIGVVTIFVCLGCLVLTMLASSSSTAKPTAVAVIATAVPEQPTQIAVTPSETPLPTHAKSTDTPSPTAAKSTSTPIPTSPPKPTATATRVVPKFFTFGDGMKIVGTDIPPGTYRATSGSSCYWERLSGFGGTLSEIIANENAAMPTLVTIAATDKGFNSKRCGGWTQDLSPITSDITAPFGEGTYIVNKDIAPGTWRSSGTGSCYWERLKGFSGELHDIIANDNASGSTIVTISSGDAGFSSKRCGTWTKIK